MVHKCVYAFYHSTDDMKAKFEKKWEEMSC